MEPVSYVHAQAQCTPPDCIGCGTQQASDKCNGVGGGGGGGAVRPPLDFPQNGLPLLQPLNDQPTVMPASSGITIFFQYFNMSWPWLLGSAAGIGVLQALIGGMEIMLFGGDSGRREAGKNKIMWALAGLLMVGLASLILETINPLFYT